MEEEGSGEDRASHWGVRLTRLRRWAWWADSGIPLPGTTWRIGFESLIGLIPVFGDWLGAVFSLWIVFEAWQMGVSGVVIARLLLNLILDAWLGEIPVVGDIFDFAWKANLMNLELIERDLARQTQSRRRSWIFFAVACVVTLGLLTAPFWILWRLLR